MSDPLHQTLMCTLKGKTLAYIVNVIPIMSERACPQLDAFDDLVADNCPMFPSSVLQ